EQREAVSPDVELLPVLAVVGAPIGTVLGADVPRLRVVGMRGDGADGRRLGQAARHQLPSGVARGHPIESRLDGPARAGLAGEAYVHVGRPIRGHGLLLSCRGDTAPGQS